MKSVACAAFALLMGSFAQPARADGVKLSHRDRLYDVAQSDGALFVVGHPGRILRSEDGGASYRDVAAGQRDEALFSIAFNTTGQGNIVGRSGYVLSTEDKGATWKKSLVTLDGERPSLFAVEVLPSGTILAVGEFGVIVRSTDRGKTWTRSSFTIHAPAASAGQSDECALESSSENENSDMVHEARLTDVRFSDERRGYAVGEFGLVLRSVDGGLTFTRQNSCTDKMLYGVAVISAERALAVGAEGSVVETHDAGVSWVPVVTHTPEHLFGVYADDARTLVVGAAGTVLARSGESPLHEARTGVHSWLTSAWLDAQGKGLIVGGRANVLGTRDGGRTQQRIFGE